MLSIGWPEMMIVAALALIVVGPRDLPKLLRSLGSMAGKARRMSNEFRAEINKVAAMDDVKEIKRSITQPLQESKREIEQEFNKITPTGFEPSKNAIKPKDPNAQSVYDEIKAATAAPGAAAAAPKIASKSQTGKAATAKTAPAPKGKSAAKPKSSTTAAKPKAAAKPKTPAKPKAVAAPKTTAKPRATTKPKPAAKPKAPAKAKPAAKPRATRKPRATKAGE